MRATKFIAGAALVLALSTTPAAAQQILWFEDASEGVSSWASGMSALGAALPGASIYNAASASDFFTSLSGGGWDLAVFGEQNQDETTPYLGGISSYISGGGLWLGATWLSGTMATVLDAGSVSLNDAAITDNGSPYYANVFGVSPIALFNPGWGIFSRSWSAQNGAACVGSLGAGCAAILGNSGRSLLLGPLGDTYADANLGRDVVLNSSLFLLDQEPVSTVPEPATMTLLATGLAGMAAARKRKLKA